MSSKKNVMLTTSREPTDKIRTFCNDIARSIPNVIRVNRGKLSFDAIAEKALELHANRMVIVDRWREGFANIQFFWVGNSGLTASPPQLDIASVRLRREFEVRIKPIKSLAITVASENFSVSKRLGQSIGNFFNLPVFAGRDIASDFSAVMHISSEASDRFQISFILLPTLIEVGPRFNVSKVVWDNSK